MTPLSLGQIAMIVSGEVVGADPDLMVTGVCTDSREVEQGSLFIALPGERTDGHDHAVSAVASGAVAVLATRPLGLPAVIVRDSQSALGLLAAAQLRAMDDVLVIGITGSSGKTTTKDLLAHVLAGAGEVHASVGSFNTEVGLPLTVLRAASTTRFLVLEYGARDAGHIRYLTGIAHPDVAVIVNVGSAHLAKFGSRECLAAAKAELVEGDGIAVLNADDEVVATLPTRRRVLRPGRASGASPHVEDVVVGADGRATFLLRHEGASAKVHLRLAGEHMVANAACAAAAALACGMDLVTVAQRLSQAEPASPWRMEVRTRPDGLTVINDAYNSNPESLRAGLRALVAMGDHGRRRTWAVLGEMRELGEEASTLHRLSGEEAVALGIDHVVCVGESGDAIGELWRGVGSGRGQRSGDALVRDVEAAVELLIRAVEPGDVVLVKASRSVGLERVALELLRSPVQGGDL